MDEDNKNWITATIAVAVAGQLMAKAAIESIELIRELISLFGF